MEAYRGEGIWRLHFYPWWWDAQYRVETPEPVEYTADEQRLVDANNLTLEQIKWRRLKQKELGRLFIQEYPEDVITCFLTSGNGYFGDLANVFTAPTNAQRQEGHEYAAGLDFGQSNDFTAMPILDLTTNTRVDLLHVNKLPWADLRRRIVECIVTGKHWGNIVTGKHFVTGKRVSQSRYRNWETVSQSR